MFSNLMQKRGLTGAKLGEERVLLSPMVGTTSLASIANGRLSGTLTSLGAPGLDMFEIESLRALASGNSMASGKYASFSGTLIYER